MTSRTPMECPICGKPPATRLQPFCSPRCADVDLGRWLTAQYTVPSAEPDSSQDDDSEPETAPRG